MRSLFRRGRLGRCAQPLLLAVASVLTACGKSGGGSGPADAGEVADLSASDGSGSDSAVAEDFGGGEDGDDAPPDLRDGDVEDPDSSDESDLLVDAHDGGLDPDADAAPDVIADSDTPPDPDSSEVSSWDLWPVEAGDDPDPFADFDAASCPERTEFDFRCTLTDPDSCPGGICLLGMCLGPELDGDRWASCGDGLCHPCEDAEACPADCGEPPAFSGEKDYDNDTTITVSVHGFSSVSGADWDTTVYGEARRSGDIGNYLLQLVPGLPDGQSRPDAPNQVIGVEYYGAIPADWMTPEQVEAIEAFDPDTEEALRRYGLIVGYFARHMLDSTGATHINFTCHSMGCHVIRYVIENNISELASENRIVRWFSDAGVIAGARLSRLFDNPTVRDAATLLNLNTSDFIHMNPDYVMDESAVWDHRLREANNPLFRGILIHSTAGTDPRVSSTADIIRLLDLDNPADEPNDGIMYSFDEYFHSQAPGVQFEAVDGSRVSPTHSFQFLDHFEISESLGTGVLAAAGLFHSRKVFVTLHDVTLRSDLEKDGAFDFANDGLPPGEVVAEVVTSYDPYAGDVLGVDGFVAEQRVEMQRSSELFSLEEGASVDAGLLLFEGPVFDDQTSITMAISLLESDYYPRFGVLEWAFDIHDELASFGGAIPLDDHSFFIENDNVRAEVRVDVVRLY